MGMKVLTPEELEALKMSTKGVSSRSGKQSSKGASENVSSTGSQSMVKGGSNVSGELLFEVTFPSKGKHGYSERIVCRPLKVSDIKPLIASRIENEIGYLKRLIKVLQSTVVEPADFDLLNLTWNDLIKLLIAHRVNSLGAVAEIGYTCDMCGSKNIWNVNLVSDLVETPIASDFVGDPFEVNGIKVRFPRIRDFLRDNVSFLTDITDYDLVKGAVGDSGVNVDDLDYATFWEILDVLRKYDRYGVETKVKVRCGKCGEEVEVVVPCFLLLVTRNVI